MNHTEPADLIRRFLVDPSLADVAPAQEVLADGLLLRPVRVRTVTWKPWLCQQPPDRRTTSAPSRRRRPEPKRDRLSTELAKIARDLFDVIEQPIHDDQTPCVISREMLRRLAKQCAECPDDAALLSLWIATMMWGSGTTNGRGPWRTYQSLGTARRSWPDAQNGEPAGPPGLLQALRPSFEMIQGAAGGPAGEAIARYEQVWTSFDIEGVGPSFFTKWMWTASLAVDEPIVRPLILDLRVHSALAVLTGKEWPSLSESSGYVAYLELLQGLSAELADLRIDPERLEYLMFWRDKEHPERALPAWVRSHQSR